MANVPTKTKAGKIIENWKEVFNESTVTTQDFPNAQAYNQVKSELLTQGTLLPIPHMPYLSTIEYGGHSYTVADSNHSTAPDGMQDSITSSPAGIQHIKATVSTVGGDDGNGNVSPSNQ